MVTTAVRVTAGSWGRQDKGVVRGLKGQVVFCCCCCCCCCCDHVDAVDSEGGLQQAEVELVLVLFLGRDAVFVGLAEEVTVHERLELLQDEEDALRVSHKKDVNKTPNVMLCMNVMYERTLLMKKLWFSSRLAVNFFRSPLLGTRRDSHEIT